MASDQLFDMHARTLRRDRAFRSGVELFLYERAFEDILQRLASVRRDFSSALLIGAPNPGWPDRLRARVQFVDVLDPGSCFARAAGGDRVTEETLDLEPARYDLAVAVGTLDTVNALPDALVRLRFALRPKSFLIGALSGGETLPRLRSAMRAADSAVGSAAPHIHPRIEPSAVAQLLSSAGFEMPVVDVDRASVSYRSFKDLIRDLRKMGATNVLTQRPRTPLTRRALAAAEEDFCSHAVAGRTLETFEILHFAAWTGD